MTTLVKSYLNRRMAVLLCMGFASGLPLALVADTLVTRLTDDGIGLGRITALIGIVQLPYAVKFLWAPLLDRFQLPRLGRRRGWILLMQILLMAAIACLGLAAPRGDATRGLLTIGAAALFVSLVSATQDIVIDAYRADVLPPDELGNGAAVSVAGYRGGMLASGAGAILLVAQGHAAWRTSYLLMPLLLVPMVVATLAAPEPAAPAAGSPVSLEEFFPEPILEFLKRRGGLIALALVLIFKFPEYLASAVTVRFMLDRGISQTELATVRQGAGLFVLVAGAIAGGAAVHRLGIFKSLCLSAVLHSASNLSFLLLLHDGGVIRMGAIVLIENACVGMTTSIFAAFLLGLCTPRYSATQYALLSGLMGLSRSLGTAPAGFLVAHLGYGLFFPVSAATGLLSLAILPLVRPGGLARNDPPESQIASRAVTMAA